MPGLKLAPRKPAETVAEMTPLELIRAIPENKLETIVMQLTGGMPSSEVVTHYIKTVREHGLWFKS